VGPKFTYGNEEGAGQVCQPCTFVNGSDGNTYTANPCREAVLRGLFPPATCEAAGQGEPGPWAGVNDCCESAKDFDYGLVDTTCDGDQLKSCKANNTWDDAASCGSDSECSIGEEVCGNCNSPDYGTVVCTASNIDWISNNNCNTCPGADGVFRSCTQTNLQASNTDYCGNCNDSDGSLVACTYTNLQAAITTAWDCQDINAGNTAQGSAWGIYADCCETHQYGVQMTCTTRSNNPGWVGYGAPTAVPGTAITDCCANYVANVYDCNDVSSGPPIDWGGYTDCCSGAANMVLEGYAWCI